MGIQRECQFLGVHVISGILEEFHVGTVVPMEVRKNHGANVLNPYSQLLQLYVDTKTLRLVRAGMMPVGSVRSAHSRINQYFFLFLGDQKCPSRYFDFHPVSLSRGDINALVQPDVPCIHGENLHAHSVNSYCLYCFAFNRLTWQRE